MKRNIVLIILMLGGIPGKSQDISKLQADSMTRMLANAKGMEKIHLLLSLAEFQIFKPGELKADFDTAQGYMNETVQLNKVLKSPEAEGNKLLTESYLVKEKGQQEESKKLVEKSITLLEKGNNKTLLGKAWYELSMYYKYEDSAQLVTRIGMVEKAAGLFEQAKNLERKANALVMLGDLYGINADYPNSKKTLLRALAAYDSIGYKRLQTLYVTIGNVYRNENDYAHALDFSLKALNVAKADRDSTMLLFQLNFNIGSIYNDIGDHAKSLLYYKEALKTAIKYDDIKAVVPTVTSIVAKYHNLYRQKEAAAFLGTIPKKYLEPEEPELRVHIALAFCWAHSDTKDLQQMKFYCEKALKLAALDISDFARYRIYSQNAVYHIYAREYAAAIPFLEMNKELSKKLGIHTISDNARWRYKADSALGNYRSALENLTVYKTISDSINTVVKERQLRVVEVEFETAKKEDSLRAKDLDIVLLTQKSELQQTNIKQSGVIKKITIGGIISLCIILSLLYRQYRRKQRSNLTISHKNELLEELVTEKEWLLKEIHHRVKNNFQTVMGLLGTQSGYLKNEAAIKAIADSQHRIHAMSLIHQRLYQTENLSAINTKDYIFELVDYLRDSYDSGNKVTFDLQVEPFELDLAHCIPLGLILNEAITNSFKYAFPNDRAGIISISLKQTSPGQVLLTIADNGTGLPIGFNWVVAESMGMNLMRGLSRELSAQIIMTSEGGTKIAVRFLYQPESVPEIAVNKFEIQASA